MLKNKYIDLKDIENDIDIDDFDNNIILDDNTESSIPEGSGSMTELLIEDSTSLGNNSKDKGKITLVVWEYIYKKYDDTE